MPLVCLVHTRQCHSRPSRWVGNANPRLRLGWHCLPILKASNGIARCVLGRLTAFCQCVIVCNSKKFSYQKLYKNWSMHLQFLVWKTHRLIIKLLTMGFSATLWKIAEKPITATLWKLAYFVDNWTFVCVFKVLLGMLLLSKGLCCNRIYRPRPLY